MKAFETAKPRQAIVIAKLFLLMDERNLASENALDASLRAGGSSGDP
jgi:hypothetical protein